MSTFSGVMCSNESFKPELLKIMNLKILMFMYLTVDIEQSVQKLRLMWMERNDLSSQHMRAHTKYLSSLTNSIVMDGHIKYFTDRQNPSYICLSRPKILESGMRVCDSTSAVNLLRRI